MYKIIFSIIFLTTSLLAQEIQIPQFPKKGTKDKFIPPDWEILSELEGDLNNDKLNDIAMVLKHKYEENLEESPRILVVCFQEKPNQYKRVVVTTKAILGKAEGGAMGDPFQAITWNRGSILIEHFGGSSVRWSYSHRFQYRDGNFVLIGETITNHNTFTGEGDTTDRNLLTGNTIITTVDSKGKSKSKTKKESKKPLKKLFEFDPRNVI